jgi:hypothetical protein
VKDRADHPQDCGCGCRDFGPSRPLEEDPVVEGLDPDCTREGGFTVLRGYLGRGVAEGAWRLYLTLGLDEYYLLREEDIVAQHQEGRGSLVWVLRGAVIRRVRVGSAEDLAGEYLSGQIADRRPGFRGTGDGWSGGAGDSGTESSTWDGCPQSYTRSRPCKPC